MRTVTTHDRPIEEREYSPPRSPSHRLTLSPSYPRRRAFTLLEAMLATVIGTVLLFAGLGLITTLERTDRSLAVRADESVSLQRMRLVFQRSFDSILVASRPTTSRVATAVATPAPGTPARATNRATSGADPASPDPAASTPTRPTSRFDDHMGAAPASQATSPTTSRTTSPASSPAKGALAPSEDPTNSRVFLHYDAVIAEPMAGTPGAGLLGLIRPQRLEMVLTDSPVPARRQDPFVLAHALAREQRLSRRADSPEAEAPPEPDQPAPAQAAPADEESQEPALRAVRGAFELVPQPTNPSDDRGTLWELWWVPRAARRSLDEVRSMGRVAAEAELAGTGEPYRIAGDIRALRIRAFDDREKKEVYSAIVQSQLPAYAEVEVEMRSGRTAQWLFEISWATGPETREQAQNAQTGRTGAANSAREQRNAPLNYERNVRQKAQRTNPNAPQTK